MKLILTNLPPDQATSIAKMLVEEKLAACVNILPIQSVYRWKGEICEEEERTLFIKTSAATAPQLKTRLLELHPYDLPEIVGLDVSSEDSNMDYLQWVVDETSG
jgi:periplasmic divalent cation tolerance protein